MNHIIIAFTFTGLAVAPFSQRARCAIAYATFPGLIAVIIQCCNHIDLASELTFYSAFHTDIRNVAIHVVFVPLIVWTAMFYVAYVPLPQTTFRVFHKPINFAHILAAAFSIFHIRCDAALGALAALLWWAMAISATWAIDTFETCADKATTPRGKPKAKWSYGTCAMISGLVHVLSWYMQLHPGHAIFEGRKPALVDAMYQSFSVAPLFVFFEGAFALGYRPELAQLVHEGVATQHHAWASGQVAA